MRKEMPFAILLLFIGSAQAAQQPAGAGLPSITEKTAGMQKFEGYFNLYWEEKAEKMWLEIERWKTEFLYVTSIPSSIEGRDRGAWNGGWVVQFERTGSKVFLTRSNYGFRALGDNPVEQRAVAEAYTSAVVFGFRVAAEEGDRVLVDATDFFVRDAQNLGLGGLDKNRSAFYWSRTRSFPKNTEVELTLTFNERGGTSIRLHHSMVELPDSRFQPRRYDPRAGVQGIDFLDYATPFSEPIRRSYSCRFRLFKKDPGSPVSDPVQPIVYYVDPTVPEPIQSALVEGASWWNQAFEAIGFRNAFQVKVLPAEADPMDLRYNMILWIHRPTRGWSSGASVRDPRTGEIICGRVYLGSQRIRQDFMIASGLKPLYGDPADPREAEELALLRIRQLSAHEVGHTLGFNHNYAASVMGRASVMDYPHPYIGIREDGTLDFSDAYTRGIGEWDKVFIAFAYSHFPDGTDENAALNKILDDAHARGMYLLNDVGAGSASPYTHQWDHGADALAELERVMQIRQIALDNFSEKNIPVGTPMARLEEVLVPIYLFHRYQTEAASKSVGGVDYRMAVRGDGQKTVEVVAPATQRRALDLVLDTVMPEALALPRHLIQLIPPRSGLRGGEVFPRRTDPTFDPLSAAETAANLTLTLLLDRNRAARLLSNRALDENCPTLEEVVDAILSRTWKADPAADSYHAEIQRVVDSVALYRLMALAADPEAVTQVRAVAAYKLDQLKWWLQSPDAASREAHRALFHFAAAEIERFQADPAKFVIPQPAVAPPGAPIGSGDDPWPVAIGDPPEPE